MPIPLRELKRLPRRVQLIPGESLNGAIVRMAAANRDLPARFASKIGADFPKVFYPRDHLERFRRVMGISQDEMSVIAPAAPFDVGYGKLSTFGGHHFPRHMLRQSQRRVCLDCLKESPHHRAIWTLYLEDWCHRHGGALTQVCPACAKRLSWNSRSPTHCQCGTDLRRVEPDRRSRGTPGDVTATQFIEDFCLTDKPDLPLALHGMTLAEIYLIASGVGALSIPVPFNGGTYGTQNFATGLKLLSGDPDEAVTAIREGIVLWQKSINPAKLAWMKATIDHLEVRRPIGASCLAILRRVMADLPDNGVRSSASKDSAKQDSPVASAAE